MLGKGQYQVNILYVNHTGILHKVMEDLALII